MKILKRMLQKIQTIKRRKLIEILNSKKKCLFRIPYVFNFLSHTALRI